MHPLGRSDPTVDFASDLPAKEASHLPINKPNNPVIVNYAVDSVKSLCMKRMSGSLLVFEKRISPSRAWIRPLLRMLGSGTMWGASPASIGGLYYV